MPVTHFSKVFAVTDAKIAKLLTDPSGGSPTYATSMDVPGIKEVTISGDIERKELRGDNGLLDVDVTISNVTAQVNHAKLHLDVLAIILGGTVTDSGTTPSQVAEWSLLNTSKPGYFRLEAVSASADPVGGAVKFTLHKAIASGFPDLGLAEEDYRTTGFQASCMPLLANGKWITAAVHETAPVLT